MMYDLYKYKQITEENGLTSQQYQAIQNLFSLALDQRGSSSATANELWSQIAAELWCKWRNPWLILQMITKEKLLELASDAEFHKLFNKHVKIQQDYLASKGWFRNTYPNAPFKTAAYFSMEFGLSEALPIYSGGLGILAGDYLKSASDLDLPLVGVGLLYQRGYFRQFLDSNNRQKEIYPYNEPDQLPIVRAKSKGGDPLSILVDYPGRSISFRVWEVLVGKIKLYLLDSNDAINNPIDRGLTNELYSGNPEHRLRQEIALGIGGWKLLQTLEITPEICHLNEGHAAFVIIARVQTLMDKLAISFEEALTIARAGNLFTTHTAVDAGFDRFPPELISEYFSLYASKLGISLDTLLGLGRENPNNKQEPFNMAFFAFRGSGAVNGVSRLHGDVSRRLFSKLFPRWPINEVPVGYVTNGVHIPSWESPAADALWTTSCGKKRWQDPAIDLKEDFKKISDEELWNFRNNARHALIKYIRTRLVYQKKMLDRPPEELVQAECIFNANTLTIGFARRFAAYKRVNLLLDDQARLKHLIFNTKQPVQIVIAGKAHPQDDVGKDIITQWINFVRQPEIRPHIIFLGDYDILMAERLVQGVDVWINTPRRPWEASGTSGMKLLVNGGLNLSELDGWWAEAYEEGVGWAIGDGQEHGADVAWDHVEASEMYSTLEEKVIPFFYKRDEKGIPREWLSYIRNSMMNLTPRFSSDRMVREYIEKYYLPGASLYAARLEEKGRIGSEISLWTKTLEDKWKDVQFLNMEVRENAEHHTFQVDVDLGELAPDTIRVELYAQPNSEEQPYRQVMQRQPCAVSGTAFTYTAVVPASLPASNYTPRITPYCKGALIPAEAKEILWQR